MIIREPQPSVRAATGVHENVIAPGNCLDRERGHGGFFAKIYGRHPTVPYRYIFREVVRTPDLYTYDWVWTDLPSGESSIVYPVSEGSDEKKIYLYAEETTKSSNVPFGVVVWMYPGPGWMTTENVNGTDTFSEANVEYRFTYHVPFFAEITGEGKTSPSDTVGNGDYSWKEIYRDKKQGDSQIKWYDVTNGRTSTTINEKIINPARDANGKKGIASGTIVQLYAGQVEEWTQLYSEPYSQEWLFQVFQEVARYGCLYDASGTVTVSGAPYYNSSYVSAYTEGPHTEGVTYPSVSGRKGIQISSPIGTSGTIITTDGTSTCQVELDTQTTDFVKDQKVSIEGTTSTLVFNGNIDNIWTTVIIDDSNFLANGTYNQTSDTVWSSGLNTITLTNGVYKMENFLWMPMNFALADNLAGPWVLYGLSGSITTTSRKCVLVVSFTSTYAGASDTVQVYPCTPAGTFDISWVFSNPPFEEGSGDFDGAESQGYGQFWLKRLGKAIASFTDSEGMHSHASQPAIKLGDGLTMTSTTTTNKINLSIGTTYTTDNPTVKAETVGKPGSASKRLLQDLYEGDILYLKITAYNNSMDYDGACITVVKV